MIDRIEELLWSRAAEDDEEEQEDVLALLSKEEIVPASPRRDKGEAGNGDADDRSGGRTAGEIVLERPGPVAGENGDGSSGDRGGGRTVGEIVLERPGAVAGENGDDSSGDRGGGRTAGEIVLERPGPVAGENGDNGSGDRSSGRTAGEIALEQPGSAIGETETGAERAEIAGELWKGGPVWTVQSGVPEVDRAQKAVAAQRTVQAGEVLRPADGDLAWDGLERAVPGGTADLALNSVGRFGPAQAGLEGLYRQAVQGLRPAASALPPEQAGRTARTQEPGSAASLAVDELDRAVRRDSRRYDGGMSIY